MSHQYENDMAKEMHRATGDDVRTYRCGYSGNNAMPQPDVLVATTYDNYALELKGPIQSDRCYVDEDDIEQLIECQNAYTRAVLVIKFPRREPLVVQFFQKLTDEQHPEADEYNALSAAEKFAVLIPDAFDPRVTDSGKLAVSKPDTAVWPSASAGSADVDAILSGLGVPTEKSVQVD
jgi:Holliday junction resolvase